MCHEGDIRSARDMRPSTARKAEMRTLRWPLLMAKIIGTALIQARVSHCRTGITVMQDIKELIGTLMRALANDEITEGEIIDLGFEADGQLLPALNDAYIKLLEFVHDRNLRRTDRDLDQRERAALQDCLNKIVNLCDHTPS
jgi:hypothetical protein